MGDALPLPTSLFQMTAKLHYPTVPVMEFEECHIQKEVLERQLHVPGHGETVHPPGLLVMLGSILESATQLFVNYTKIPTPL